MDVGEKSRNKEKGKGCGCGRKGKERGSVEWGNERGVRGRDTRSPRGC